MNFCRKKVGMCLVVRVHGKNYFVTELDLEYKGIKDIKEIEGLELLKKLVDLELGVNPKREDERYLVDKSAQEVVKYCQEKVRNTKS